MAASGGTLDNLGIKLSGDAFDRGGLGQSKRRTGRSTPPSYHPSPTLDAKPCGQVVGDLAQGEVIERREPGSLGVQHQAPSRQRRGPSTAGVRGEAEAILMKADIRARTSGAGGTAAVDGTGSGPPLVAIRGSWDVQKLGRYRTWQS